MFRKILIKIDRILFFKPKMNYWATFYFNIRVLPLSQALKFPIYFYGKWSFKSLQGKIVINSSDIKRGMFHFGADTASYFSSSLSTLSLHRNSLILISPLVRIGQGINICCYPNSVLELGENCGLGDRVIVICKKSIRIQAFTDITWDCQVTDYNSHYIINTVSRQINNIIKPVDIGMHCWICNRTTIMPGTILPSWTIVASNSLISKDYTKVLSEPSYALLAGVPAKIVKTNQKRIYDIPTEEWLNTFFENNTISDVQDTILPINLNIK